MRRRIVQHLAEQLSPPDAERALRVLARPGNVLEQLIAVGIAPETALRACCHETGVPPAPARWLQNPRPIAGPIDVELCRKLQCAPIAMQKGVVCIAYSDPEVAMNAAKNGFGHHVAYLAPLSELDAAFQMLPASSGSFGAAKTFEDGDGDDSITAPLDAAVKPPARAMTPAPAPPPTLDAPRPREPARRAPPTPAADAVEVRSSPAPATTRAPTLAVVPPGSAPLAFVAPQRSDPSRRKYQPEASDPLARARLSPLDPHVPAPHETAPKRERPVTKANLAAKTVAPPSRVKQVAMLAAAVVGTGVVVWGGFGLPGLGSMVGVVTPRSMGASVVGGSTAAVNHTPALAQLTLLARAKDLPDAKGAIALCTEVLKTDATSVTARDALFERMRRHLDVHDLNGARKDYVLLKARTDLPTEAGPLPGLEHDLITAEIGPR